MPSQTASRHHGGNSPPAHPGAERWALFLDFDGTLVDIAMTPDAVVIPADLRPILRTCRGAFGGAAAIVTGRPIAAVDAMLEPLRLPAAGLHGLELRMADGTLHSAGTVAEELDGLRPLFQSLVREDARLVVEDKGTSFTLHYRRAPERESELRSLVARAASERRGYRLLLGNMIVEIVPAIADKGTAIDRFLESPPFAGRTPVFAGDDITDEDGFASVNRHGGISIKVGPGESVARYRMSDAGAVREWLTSIASDCD